MSKSSNDRPETDARTADLAPARRHRLLAAKRRRLAIDAVADRTAPLALSDLAATVAASEDGIDAADEEAVQRVAATLHHTHLPKLSEAGVVSYNPDSRRIDPSGAAVDS